MKKKLFLVLLIFLIGIGDINAKEREEVRFSKCVDGDTIKVFIKGKEKTVRFLAMDTPETVSTKKDVEYYGKEASDFTCNNITKANILEIEYDSNSDKTDKYGRVLAWVFVDDVLLQGLLVSSGYAKVAYLYSDYEYTNILKGYEANAKELQIGVWDDIARANFYNNTSNLSWVDIIVILGIILIAFIMKQNKYIKKIVKEIKKVGKI